MGEMKRRGLMGGRVLAPFGAMALLFMFGLVFSIRAGDKATEGVEGSDGAGAQMSPVPLPAASTVGGYDVLPLLFADLSKYDQIALEPYRDRYDNMPIGEKAKVYGQAFEFMRNRRPRFDPKITLEADRFQTVSKSKNAIVLKQHMYKPPVPKKKVKKKVEAAAAAGGEASAALLGSLPGPWEQNAQPGGGGETVEEAGEVEEVVEEVEAGPAPSYKDYVNDSRMENLRQGWNAKDVLRGRRTR